MFTRRNFLQTTALGAATLGARAQGAAAAARRVSFALFDSHAHLISTDLARYPRVADAAGRPAQPAADVQVPEAEKLLAWMDENNVGSAAVAQLGGLYGVNNYYVLDSAERFRSRLLPVVGLDAADEATPDLLRQYARERGLAALRITGGPQADGSLPWLDSPAAQRSWAVANELSLAVVVMNTPPGRLPAVVNACARLAAEHPAVRLVLDQLGWPDVAGGPEYGIDALHRSLQPTQNVYFKFSSINLQQLAKANVAAPALLRHVVDVYGADRVMWGSDIGHSTGTYASQVGAGIDAVAQLSADEQRKVLRESGMRVFVRGGARRG